MNRIMTFLNGMKGRQDLALVAILMATIILMILPMPTALVDALIALNISLTVLILMVAVYLDKPVSFSTFPAVILLATTFRLAISISTTRLILSEADAGAIIETFGTFVTAGNVIVGLVIFLIITTVQFVVITRGSERVAEVAARFVLDALPGRQMSIDAELRAGDIDQAEARRRRRQLDKENQFFGAMDGAMKFVKGDAIAGLIIIAVNLLGGIAVGTLQMGMSIGEAAQVYSRLTVGDGLVAQIPALFMALCAGAVITRVTSDEKSDLGSEIAEQIAGSGKTMLVAAIIVFAIGFVPGFPTPMFAVIAAGLGWLAWVFLKRERERTADEASSDEDGVTMLPGGEKVDTTDAMAKSGDFVTVRVGADVMEFVDPAGFMEARHRVLRGMSDTLGVKFPKFGLMADPALAGDMVEIDMDDVPLFSASIPGAVVIARADPETLDLANVRRMALRDPWPLTNAYFVPADEAGALAEAQVRMETVADLLAETAGFHLRRNAGALIGFQQVDAMVRELQADSPHLADQIANSMPVTKMLDVLRRLVGEGVPLLPRRVMFEALAEWSTREDDPALLSENMRRALRRQVCQTLADKNRVIAGYVIEPELEDILRESLRTTEAGPGFQLSSRVADIFLSQLQSIQPPADIDARPAVIMTAPDIRRHVHGYLQTHGIDMAVIAFNELPREFHMQPVGTMGLPPTREAAAA